MGREILESIEDCLLFINLKPIKYVAKNSLSKSVATNHESVAEIIAEFILGQVERA